MSHLESAYNPDERLADPPEDHTQPLRGIELNFAIPVYLTREQEDLLFEVMSAITCAPYNTPREGTHWLASSDSKLTLSADRVLVLSSCARSFISDRERMNSHVARQRAVVGAAEVAQAQRQKAEVEERAAAATKRLLEAAVAYWAVTRPAEFNIQQYLSSPDLNATTERQRQFSRAVVEAIKLGVVEGPQ